MPQQDMSSRIGKSSSPIVNRVIQNSKDGQAPVNPATVTKSGQLNKQTVKP